jgi:hypothetical protein
MEEVDASELDDMFDDVDDGDMSSGLSGLEKKVSSATLDVVRLPPSTPVSHQPNPSITMLRWQLQTDACDATVHADTR